LHKGDEHKHKNEENSQNVFLSNPNCALYDENRKHIIISNINFYPCLDIIE
jgi:hypothetical protein